MFLQVHTLTSYPSSLLNRDDVGLAKRLPFGGATRTRISSQCLKRHWRTFEGDGSILSVPEKNGTVPMALRSRRIFENEIRGPLEKAGVDPEVARSVTESLMAIVLGESPKKKEASDKEQEAGNGEEPKAGNGKKSVPRKRGDEPDETVPREKLETNQVAVLGRPEVTFLYEQALAIAKNANSLDKIRDVVRAHFKGAAADNLKALRHGAGLDAALFGRMVTSDLLARCDAAVHVAHAMTVHTEMTESDYFSVVDDLFSAGDEPQLGSGHIGTSELTSGLYYGYAVVDVPLLVSNLEGCDRKQWQRADRSLAASVAERLVRLIATVSPGAKLGSTAPYACAHTVLLEVGVTQPRTLANAFLKPVDPVPDLVRNTYDSLTQYLHEVDAMHGNSNERRFAAIQATDALHAVATREEKGLLGLTEWAATKIRSAQ